MVNLIILFFICIYIYSSRLIILTFSPFTVYCSLFYILFTVCSTCNTSLTVKIGCIVCIKCKNISSNTFSTSTLYVYFIVIIWFYFTIYSTDDSNTNIRDFEVYLVYIIIFYLSSVLLVSTSSQPVAIFDFWIQFFSSANSICLHRKFSFSSSITS